MLVLGFESSCDETGVALVDASGSTVPRLLSHALFSQIDMHQAYGGVVPELASRDHIRRVLPLARQVLEEVDVKLSEVDAVAYTRGPGLAGALLVGAEVVVTLLLYTVQPHLAGHLERRIQPVRRGFIRAEESEVGRFKVESHHVAQEPAEDACGLGFHGAWLGHRNGVDAEGVRVMQARPLRPLMFIVSEPQTPSRHERRNASVSSCRFRRSSTSSSM